MSKLDKIKARLAAARGLEWHSYKLARYKDGRVDYAVAPSPLERTHFSEGEAEFVVCSREYVALLLAVVEAHLDKMPLQEAVATIQELGHEKLVAAWEALS